MAKKTEQVLPPITFVAAGETDDEREANLEAVLPSPGFPTAAQLVAEVIEKRSDTTVMDFTPQIVNLRFRIDGVWHNMPPMDRETGDYMLATLKQLAGSNYQDRRSRQEGHFRAELMRVKHKCRLLSQGIKSGERVALYVDLPKPEMETVENMGMAEGMKSSLSEILGSERGMILSSALPGEGYTTVWRGMFAACDRFMRDYYVIEEKKRVEPEVINISSITFDESAGETAFSPIPKLLLREPNVIAFADSDNTHILNQMIELSENEVFVPTRTFGKHAVDAVVRLMVHKPDVQKLAQQLKAVLCMRVVRKLCETCRQPFVPHPSLLQKLGLPVGRVRQMYKAFEFQPGMVDPEGDEIEVCAECCGIGYRGLTGIFELLVVDDRFRKAMIETPHIEKLTAAARASGHISIRQTGIVAVAKGITSLEELQRVLKK